MPMPGTSGLLRKGRNTGCRMTCTHITPGGRARVGGHEKAGGGAGMSHEVDGVWDRVRRLRGKRALSNGLDHDLRC